MRLLLCAIALAGLLAPAAGAEMVVRTKDGRKFTLPIASRELRSIEFTENAAPAKPAPPAAPRCGLGVRWEEKEGDDWTGEWRRRGDSNVFDAVWKRGGVSETGELTIAIAGGRVTIDRALSDGVRYRYEGVLAADGVTIDGTYRTLGDAPGDRGPWKWSARIVCESN